MNGLEFLRQKAQAENTRLRYPCTSESAVMVGDSPLSPALPLRGGYPAAPPDHALSSYFVSSIIVSAHYPHPTRFDFQKR